MNFLEPYSFEWHLLLVFADPEADSVHDVDEKGTRVGGVCGEATRSFGLWVSARPRER